MTSRFSRIAVFALALAAAGLSARSALSDAKKGRAVFTETAHNFGKVKQGDVLTHEFVFKNAGPGTLVVERVETSCGCTAALASADKIEPGAEGKIKTTFDTRGYSGKMTRYVYFLSNDEQAARRELSVTADIEVPPQPRIELDKYNIDMGLSLEGESPTARVQIKNIGERELTVEMAHQDIKFFVDGKAAAFPLHLATGKSVDVEFRFPPQTKPGALRDYVLIRSNDSVRSTLSVYLSRYVITRKDLKDLFTKYRSILEERR